jgi:hypothetical protein
LSPTIPGFRSKLRSDQQLKAATLPKLRLTEKANDFVQKLREGIYAADSRDKPVASSIHSTFVSSPAGMQIAQDQLRHSDRQSNLHGRTQS